VASGLVLMCDACHQVVASSDQAIAGALLDQHRQECEPYRVRQILVEVNTIFADGLSLCPLSLLTVDDLLLIVGLRSNGLDPHLTVAAEQLRLLREIRDRVLTR